MGDFRFGSSAQWWHAWGCGGSKRAHGWSVRSTSGAQWWHTFRGFDIGSWLSSGRERSKEQTWGMNLLPIEFLFGEPAKELRIEFPNHVLADKLDMIGSRKLSGDSGWPCGDHAAWLNFQVVLREAILSCVTPDRSRLPLLDAYVPWIKTNDFVRAPWQRQGHSPEMRLGLLESVVLKSSFSATVF